MSRILIRAKVSPFESHGAAETLKKSLLGNNSGNLLFAYSVTRLLDDGENEISFIPDYMVTKGRVDAAWMNENFDYVVLPMANSFRSAYDLHLIGWANAIRQLKIPCVVIGIGVQLEHGESYADKHPYDDAAKAFVSAVLDHSAQIAVRGEVTAAYLNHLGFSDVEVTGCPSMALAGPKFPIDSLPQLESDTVMSVTGSVKSPVNFQDFMRRTMDEYGNCYFIPQFNEDLALMYFGTPITRAAAQGIGYPVSMDDPVFLRDRARFFLNIKSMLEFNRGTAFNFGTRIHGCISNIVCGVPSVLFAQDQRVGELGSYHHLPILPLDEIGKESSLIDFYDRIDLAYI